MYTTRHIVHNVLLVATVEQLRFRLISMTKTGGKNAKESKSKSIGIR